MARLAPVDYGPAPKDLVAMIDSMRPRIDVDSRLVIAKLLARTVTADGDLVEQVLAQAIDRLITTHFRVRYSGDDPNKR